MSDAPTRVLLIDDDEDDHLMFREVARGIEGRQLSVEWAPSYDRGKELLLGSAHDVCVMDYRLGVRTGLDLLKEAVETGCKTPIILLTGYGEREVDLEAMRVGAADYLVKDELTPYLLERSIRYSVHRAQNLEARKKMEAQILMQDRLASIGLLASSLAHEIGTPMGVIRGRAEFLSMRTSGDTELRKNSDIIIAQIDRLSKLIRSLLTLARGEEIRHAQRVFLGEVVADVLELMAHELRKNSIETRNAIGSDFPVKVSAEAGPLHQVVLNLLVNAIHAIESAAKNGRPAGHFIRVGVADREHEGLWALEIEDSGCGISEAHMRNLFQPFFTTKDIGVGTGLGLATSYRIVESWGGRIEAESRVGVGTTFRVLLPKG